MLGTTVNSLCILIGTSIEVRKMTEESKKRSFNLNIISIMKRRIFVIIQVKNCYSVATSTIVS